MYEFYYVFKEIIAAKGKMLGKWGYTRMQGGKSGRGQNSEPLSTQYPYEITTSKNLFILCF